MGISQTGYISDRVNFMSLTFCQERKKVCQKLIFAIICQKLISVMFCSKNCGFCSLSPCSNQLIFEFLCKTREVMRRVIKRRSQINIAVIWVEIYLMGSLCDAE